MFHQICTREQAVSVNVFISLTTLESYQFTSTIANCAFANCLIV